MTSPASRAVGFGAAVHVARLAVIPLGLVLAPVLGITGWWPGLFVDALCTVHAGALATWLGLWGRVGVDLRWRGGVAALALLVLLAEALWWLVSDGLAARPPGIAPWVLTLLLVGVNEELVSRGVVLFGLQHLSAFLTTGRGTYDVLTNVVVSGCYGFALAAFQLRFAWVMPLVLLHALADLTTIWAAAGHDDLAVAASLLVFLGLGAALLRGAHRPAPTTCA